MKEYLKSMVGNNFRVIIQIVVLLNEQNKQDVDVYHFGRTVTKLIRVLHRNKKHNSFV